MELKIIEMIIVLIERLLYIIYYHTLMMGGKVAKLLLIGEIGLKAMSVVYLIMEGSFTSYQDLLQLLPVFLSITLYTMKGTVAKILFYLLSSFSIIIVSMYMYQIFISIFYIYIIK